MKYQDSIGMSREVKEFCSINEPNITKTEVTYDHIKREKTWIFVTDQGKVIFTHSFDKIEK